MSLGTGDPFGNALRGSLRAANRLLCFSGLSAVLALGACGHGQGDAPLDFMNAKYRADLGFGKEEYAFRDSVWTLDRHDPSAGYLKITKVLPSAIRNAPNDFIIEISYGSGNTGQTYVLLVERSDLGVTTLGQLPSYGDTRIEGRTIVTQDAEWLAGDARCCPSIRIERTWEWGGASFTQTGERRRVVAE